MSVIKMTQTSGVYTNGTTYRLRAREAQTLLGAAKATPAPNKFIANVDIRKGKP